MIPLKSVTSSNLESVGHDPVSNTLAVKFKGRDEVHHFANVPADLVAEMHAAESIGGFFAKRIRGQYEHTKLDA